MKMDSPLDRSLGPGFDALEALLDEPEGKEAYEREVRIMVMTRRLLMAIDAERERRGLSKAELAQLVGANPQVIRRLFTSERANPTIKTVLGILAALRIDLTFALPEGSAEAAPTPTTGDRSGEMAADEPEKRAHTSKKAAKGRKEEAA